MSVSADVAMKTKSSTANIAGRIHGVETVKKKNATNLLVPILDTYG